MQTATQHSYTFTHSDNNYRNAINYEGTQYCNAPITFSIDGKTFIVPFGTQDCKHVHIDGNHVYIVGENQPLQYIGMVCIDLESDNVTDCFFSENDLHMFGNVFELPTEEQVILLSNYLPY